ncbi:MAG TPA: NUDIX hydrolase [Thermodesulfobacteriota bacterium]|nr:NUDIX hydrolase [Thermodesulfobacteriota bacterium]
MSKAPTKTQVSSGGVVFRKRGNKIDVAIISVGNKRRWQLPKGTINNGESPESAAMREAREETGIDTEMVGPIDKIEYWYYLGNNNKRVRFHKFVHFYLLRYKSGDLSDHDQEVNEARWVEINKAYSMLAFKSEKEVVKKAREMIERLEQLNAKS